MGQRLNLEIQSNGEVLANSYFHWGAYTRSAIGLTKIAYACLKESKETDPLKKAIYALQATGAGFTEDEIKELNKRKIILEELQVASNRSNGLISITEEGINETCRWEEGASIIDLDRMTINFNAIIENDNENYNKEDIEKMLILENEIDFSNITEDDLLLLEEICDKAYSNETYVFKDSSGIVFSMVE